MMSGSFRDIDFFSYRKKGSKFLKVVNKKNCVNSYPNYRYINIALLHSVTKRSFLHWALYIGLFFIITSEYVILMTLTVSAKKHLYQLYMFT